MRLGEDDRGRVPFALVGVLLLVGAASYAATLGHRPPAAERPDAVAAMNRVEGTTATAVHRGTKRAARAAARAPLVEPADTPGGRVLDGDDTFRDYLRLRIYLAIRDALGTAAVTVGSTEAVPSLPPTPDAGALAAAKRRVHLTRVDGGLRVEVENVTVRLREAGRVVAERNRTVVRTVATPVLAVHERVRRYERRLNRDPDEGPGLGRRLTARLNAIAWTRGYAQYGGAPIVNVVTNRHVELQANGALLATQRATFGRSDPAGRAATRQATVVVGTTDVLLGGIEAADTAHVLPDGRGVRAEPGAPTPGMPDRPPDAADGNVTVGVDLTADAAFAAFVSGEGATTLESTVASVYGADVRVVGARVPVASSIERPPDPPGQNWTLLGEWTTREVVVRPADRQGPSPDVPGGMHRLANHTRRVAVVETTHRRWARGAGAGRVVRTTEGSRTRTSLVTVALVGRHADSGSAPSRGIATVHERGGPLDGPNLRGIAERASDRVAERYGGPDELVRRYVSGSLPGGTVRVAGERPAGLRDWLLADLARLRERVRNLSVTVPRTRLGAGEVNPAAVLVERLRQRRASLVDAPGTYGSVGGKARVAARSAYLAAVIERLERRAERNRETTSRFERVLEEHDFDPATLAAALDAGTTTERPPARPAATGGPLGSLNATVAATPAYLTLSGVTHEQLPAVPSGERYHPLVAQNVNLFSVPYDDAADAIVGELLAGPDRTSLAAAARTLRSANRSLARSADPALARRRDDLRASVARSLAYLRERLAARLREATSLSKTAAAAAVNDGFGRWGTTAARALAAANGSLAAAVARAAARRSGPAARTSRPVLTARLRVELAEARREPEARPRQPTVNESAEMTRAATKAVVSAGLERGRTVAAEKLRRKLDGKLTYPPAGLPVAPVPGYWYVTTNVWAVNVSGEYLRFSVSVPTGTPGRNLTYRRRRTAVAVDWDGDGDRERLGRSTRLSFSVSTGIVVVVPPGGPGVGDRDGNADERSAGWPHPGNATREVTTTSTPGE